MRQHDNLLVALVVGTNDLGFEIFLPNFVVAPTLPSGPNCTETPPDRVSSIGPMLSTEVKTYIIIYLFIQINIFILFFLLTTLLQTNLIVLIT